ncbi:Adaptive-response sensory-kinase SasA [Paenibacillus plantiphilus]|uniref:histidine kinase n=1 Tax=Paenibacillus plantiphilus TaxID=2905650 RepID=A0ABN8GX20_9BACL|nr:sensor histidine kinase [Paenibacillus plantiphilus]CAH1216408.1 Adaptive-response sensory-kinase SasA [Paenibacillus plantiphilus]
MRLIDYIRVHKLWILSHVMILIIINSVLYSSFAISRSAADMIYMNLLVIIVQLAMMTAGLFSAKKKYGRILQDPGGNIEQIVSSYKGDFYMDMLAGALADQRRLHREREENYKRGMNEFQEYITQWVHDMKVNLAVCELLLEDMGSEAAYPFRGQTEQMKFRVNQILHVARANHYDEDIAAEEVDVCLVLRAALKENALFFIHKNIEIHTELQSFHVISDRKWIHYIVGQILNNSSKYMPNNGRLDIWTREEERACHIHIKDSGIGIPREDIARIFDKGFTGRNGRTGTKSTGMGLYYAKQIAETLRIGIEVASREGEYTEFIISFYKLSDYYGISSVSGH